MRARAFGTVVSIAFLGITGLGLAGLVAVRVLQRMQPEAPTEGTVREIWVTSQEVRRGNIENSIRATGEIQPRQDVRVASKLPGKVRSVRVQEGESVERGQVLVRLETTELHTAKRQAVAALAAARATVDQAKLALDNQEREFKRTKGLFEANLISEQQLQQVEMMVLSARSQYEMAKTNIAQAEAAVELAGTRLADADICSPIPGVIISSHVNEGEVISPGMTLMHVIDLSAIKVEAGVSETEIMQIRRGAEALVSLVGCPEVQLRGEVTKVAHAISPGTHSFDITVEVKNPEGTIKSGMSVIVDVLVERRENVLLVPKRAVSRSGQRYACYVVDGEGIARFSPVEVLLDDGINCQISGLSEGERVIVQGNFEAVDGAKVIERQNLES